MRTPKSNFPVFNGDDLVRNGCRHKWGAVLTGEKNRGFDNDAGADWITVDGFEVVGARIDGIKMIGRHNVVRNCWVHNSASQGILGGTIIENNLVEFNGQNIQFMHGVYTSGDGLCKS